MWRRRLVFTIPKDVETHYSEIKGEYIGKIWNPLYHAYSYYLPAESSHENVRKHDNDELTGKSIRNLKVAMASMILLSPMGTNAMLINVLGSILWAESESIFAKWDGHVSFGSSHLMAHTWGFGIAAILKMLWNLKRFRWWLLSLVPFALASLGGVGGFVKWWGEDGFGVVSDVRPFGLHRTDHMAHIGGLIVGFANGFLNSNRSLVKESYVSTGILASLMGGVYIWANRQAVSPDVKKFVKRRERHSSPFEDPFAQFLN